MRHAKDGSFWVTNPQRALANNSVAFTEKPDSLTFMREWTSMVESGTGERGIFSRPASKKKAAENGRRDPDHDFGTNPCSEIILRPYQFCNLTEVVVRVTDDQKSLKRKVRLATILGTIQATYTNFPYLRDIWKKNTEEEALLGVSMTGILDNTLTSGANGLDLLANTLQFLKGIAVGTNAEFADRLGIARSAAITCVKPSGTVSQLVDSASGIHPRWSNYYIRTVRGSNDDPVTKLLKAYKVPNEPDITAPEKTTVFSFPTKAPNNCVTRHDLKAIDHCKLWKVYADSWCEHKPSITVYPRDEEWLEVGAWVYKNFDTVSGISFLPHSDHVYEQAPYQDITEEEYITLERKMPINIDWARLVKYEKTDTTVSSQAYACTADSCEIVDVT
jgi:ribonucleoside-diphosphate reductase alpha chain